MKPELTFKSFLSIIEEDLGGDISKLQADISMLDTEITKRTQPLLLKKAQLQKMLAVKQKQHQVDDKTTDKNTDGQQSGSQTTTPGSSGAATPGQP